MRSLVSLVVLLLVAGFSCGGSSEDDCTAGCNKVYTECNLTLQDPQGNPYTKEQCLNNCQQLPENKTILGCIRKVKGCDQTAMNNCIQNPSASGPQMKHPYTPPPECLSCHGPGTSSNAKKIPASHAGRTNDTCPTCHAAGS